MRTLTLALLSLLVVDIEAKPYNAPTPIPGDNFSLITLDPSTGAGCLDGSPYGFYFYDSNSINNNDNNSDANGNRVTDWTIFLMGGAWCYDEEDCLERSRTPLGTSNFNLPTLPPYIIMHDNTVCMNGNADASCNFIFLPYCDGASFSGFREDPWPVVVNKDKGKDNATTTTEYVHFKGRRNLDATIEYALEHLGLDQASEVVVKGQSAGGLATIVRVDSIAEQLRKGNQAAGKDEEGKDERKANMQLQPEVVAVSDVGFFLDHGTFNHSDRNYTAVMKNVVEMQNVSASLPQACVDSFSDAEGEAEAFRCFMAPHVRVVDHFPLHLSIYVFIRISLSFCPLSPPLSFLSVSLILSLSHSLSIPVFQTVSHHLSNFLHSVLSVLSTLYVGYSVCRDRSFFLQLVRRRLAAAKHPLSRARIFLCRQQAAWAMVRNL